MKNNRGNMSKKSKEDNEKELQKNFSKLDYRSQ